MADTTPALIEKTRGDQPGQPTAAADQITGYVRRALNDMSRFRSMINYTQRLGACLRAREGLYEPSVLADIEKFGGSSVYARLTTNKIRGAASMLRSIFIQGERPWEIKPTPVPTLPDDIQENVDKLVQSELQNIQAQGGETPPQASIDNRRNQLLQAANDAARRQARQQAVESTRWMDDLLVEGSFYQALNAFLLDFVTLPLAVMRGPTAVMATKVKYIKGIPTKTRVPILKYFRIDPYDIMWSPGGTNVNEVDVIERMRMSVADLQAMVNLDGYDEDGIRSIIREYGESGYTEYEFHDQTRDDIQNQESQLFKTMIDVIAYTGVIPGRLLKEYGFTKIDDGPIDDDFVYLAQIWQCNRYLIKVHIDPDPRGRIPYYIANYEPVPGSLIGTALPEMMADIQETYNAALRALINNLAMASGPMVSVNLDRVPAGADATSIYPWKIWNFNTDPAATAGEKAVDFFQPNINSQEIMAVLSFLQQLADEVSAIPRYMTGSNNMGGAGRTASGLSMLMGNANRTMTSVAGSIDENVLEPVLQRTYDLVLLTTGTKILRGDESIEVQGATHAETRETDRMRMLEFLQYTNNPTDFGIIGVQGRAAVLRQVANTFMNGEQIVPSEAEIEAMVRQQQAAAQAAANGQAAVDAAGQAAAPEDQKTDPNAVAAETDNMHRVAA